MFDVYVFHSKVTPVPLFLFSICRMQMIVILSVVGRHDCYFVEAGHALRVCHVIQAKRLPRMRNKFFVSLPIAFPTDMFCLFTSILPMFDIQVESCLLPEGRERLTSRLVWAPFVILLIHFPREDMHDLLKETFLPFGWKDIMKPTMNLCFQVKA